MSNEIEFVDKNDDKSQINQRIPAEYIPVKLSSLGKLDAPNTLHVRDYSGRDALELSLSTTNSNTFLRKLVDVINNLIFEGFDCYYLHESELEEIMLSITGNFISPTIQNYPYPYEKEEYDSMSDERKQGIEKSIEKLQIDIPINSINTLPLKAEFKEPIVIKNKSNLTLHFRLPRVKDYFVAEEYVEEKYFDQAQQYMQLEKITNLEDDTEKEKRFAEFSREILKSYQGYLIARGTDYIAAKQSQLLLKQGSKVLDTIEDKIKCYSEIGMGFWKQYNNLCDSELEFGVDHNIKIISPITNEEVTRRLQFRPMDLISTDHVPDPGEYSILFG